MDQFRARLTEQQSQARVAAEKLVDHHKRLVSQLTSIEELERLAKHRGNQLETSLIDIGALQQSKTDQAAFLAYVHNIDAKLKQVTEYTELSRNMVIGCENYLEKYQPLFTHRQISDALDQVVTSVKQKWRLKKFSEKQATLLIERILQDKGQPDLSGTVERLRSSLRTGAPMEGEATGDKE